ncbi:hypothetical protein DY000_02053119 [Brassica cretica]|uniref:Reverse transcriptase domain-containing protein n=1 Tax=Brassica cretica TaxID=69181 RepID=A0ABQ7A5P3_BRACR|nr:hypothetical protein DY000_02053119 [Brassica cretica]
MWPPWVAKLHALVGNERAQESCCGLKFRCSSVECSMLGAEVSDEEVRRVLFEMPSNKSPGPDGFPNTNVWSEIVSIIGDETMERKRLFCVRYAFQAVLYAVWRERNKIIHGEKLLPLSTLKSMIDKGIRNKITLMKNHGVKGMGELMQFWFLTRM